MTVKDRIVKAVLDHVGDAPPFDDMCLVVIERTMNAAESTLEINDTADEDRVEDTSGDEV